tara:strand:- start:2366 stop:3580 length:1215 start_codon:yes stop_codon:yes gene_type:complete
VSFAGKYLKTGLKSALIAFAGASAMGNPAAAQEKAPVVSDENTTQPVSNFQKMIEYGSQSKSISIIMDMNHAEIEKYAYFVEQGLDELKASGHTQLLMEIEANNRDDIIALNEGKITVADFRDRNPGFSLNFGKDSKTRESAANDFLQIVVRAGKLGIEVRPIDSFHGMDHFNGTAPNMSTKLKKAHADLDKIGDAILNYIQEEIGTDNTPDKLSAQERELYTNVFFAKSPDVYTKFLNAVQILSEETMRVRTDDRLTAQNAISEIEEHRNRNNASYGRTAILYGGGHILLDRKEGLDDILEKKYGADQVSTYGYYGNALQLSLAAYTYKQDKLANRYGYDAAQFSYIQDEDTVLNKDGLEISFSSNNEIGSTSHYKHELYSDNKVDKPCTGTRRPGSRKFGCR